MPTPRPTLIRTEMELAADVLVQLLRGGVVGTRHEVVVRVASTTSVPIVELRAAMRRNDSRGYRPPRLAATADGIPTRRAACRGCGRLVEPAAARGRVWYCDRCRREARLETLRRYNAKRRGT